MTQTRAGPYILPLSPKLSVELPGVSQDVRRRGSSKQDGTVRQSRQPGILTARRPEFRELSPGLAIPRPSVAPKGIAPEQENALAGGIVGHDVPSAGWGPRVFLLRPFLAVEFPGVLQSTAGTQAAEQDGTVPPGIKRQGVQKTRAWT